MARAFFVLFEGLENVVGGLLAEAGQGSHSAVPAGAFQLGEGMDAEFLVEQLDFFCAEALQLEEGENIGRKLFAQGVVIIQLPGRNEGGDFFRDGLADAVNFLEPFLLHEPGKIVGQGFQGAGRIGVGTDFEGVLALEFQQARRVADGMREKSDVNHRNGANILYGDLSVRFWHDRNLLLRNFMLSISDSQPPAQIEDTYKNLWKQFERSN